MNTEKSDRANGYIYFFFELVIVETLRKASYTLSKYASPAIVQKKKLLIADLNLITFAPLDEVLLKINTGDHNLFGFTTLSY